MSATRKRALIRSQLYWCPDLGHPASKTVRRKFLLVVNYPVHGTLDQDTGDARRPQAESLLWLIQNDMATERRGRKITDGLPALTLLDQPPTLLCKLSQAGGAVCQSTLITTHYSHLNAHRQRREAPRYEMICSVPFKLWQNWSRNPRLRAPFISRCFPSSAPQSLRCFPGVPFISVPLNTLLEPENSLLRWGFLMRFCLKKGARGWDTRKPLSHSVLSLEY